MSRLVYYKTAKEIQQAINRALRGMFCAACMEPMPLDANQWRQYADKVYHDTGSCLAEYERRRQKGRRDASS